MASSRSSDHRRDAGAAPSVGRKRIVFVGASYLFVHRVVRDLLLVGGFDECEIVLHDLDPVPLKLVGDLVERMARQAGSAMRITRTTERDAALTRADCVVLSITTGGRETDARSAECCARYGIPVAIGDTMGPAALARNLRTIPVAVELVAAMERLCPDALFLNFTNPMSAITGAIARRRSIPVFGLCHSADELRQWFAGVFGCAVGDVGMDLAGVNHQSFVTALRIGGIDRTADIGAAAAASSRPTRDELRGHEEDTALQREIHALLGAWPSTGGDHLAEFYPFYLTPRRLETLRFASLRRIEPGRAPFGRKDPHPLLPRWAYGPDGVGDMDRMTDEHAHELMHAWFTGEPFTRSVNVLNDGAVAGIADDACVELMATVSGRKLIRRRATLPTAALSWVQRWTAIHDLTIRAALACDRDLARQALMLDPHVRDARDIAPLLDDLLAALKAWMPAAWYPAPSASVVVAAKAGTR